MDPSKFAVGISLPAMEVLVISMVLSAVQPSSKSELITESQVQPHTPPDVAKQNQKPTL